MTLLDISISLEENSELHLSRMLVLIGTFAGRRGNRTINGLTKLAKLDFLLRYPVYLGRALDAINVPKVKADVKEFERANIESAMIRYRYGPWDHRYRKFINMMVGKGLITVSIEGRTTKISMTSKGLETYGQIVELESFYDVAKRAKILKQHFDISGTRLMKFIYKTFPEITTLKLGERIDYEY